MTIEFKIAELADILDVVDHDIRHFSEPGFNGQLSHPFPLHHEWDKEKMRKERLTSWPKAVTEEQWGRSFLILENGDIIGHLNLKNLFSGTLHRAQLGMGLEQVARGRGLGTKLLKMAIAWAKEQESLHWIDLTVLAHNLPARKLYANHGFVEQCTVKDRLRVEGVSIDDVVMTLKLR